MPDPLERFRDAYLRTTGRELAFRNGEWWGCCPSHADDTPSMSAKLEGGKLLLNDFGGCDSVAVLQAVGLKKSDLFQSNGHSKPKAYASALHEWAERRGFSVSTLQAAGVKGSDDGREILIPMRGPESLEVGFQRRRADNQQFSGSSQCKAKTQKRRTTDSFTPCLMAQRTRW